MLGGRAPLQLTCAIPRGAHLAGETAYLITSLVNPTRRRCWGVAVRLVRVERVSGRGAERSKVVAAKEVGERDAHVMPRDKRDIIIGFDIPVREREGKGEMEEEMEGIVDI